MFEWKGAGRNKEVEAVVWTGRLNKTSITGKESEKGYWNRRK